MRDASRDQNFVTSLLGVSSTDGSTPVPVYADPTTHRLLVDLAVSGADIASHIQTETYSSTNNQTTFNASTTVLYTLGFYVNGSLQTPSTDYSVVANDAVLSSGIPAGCSVVWVYIK